MLHCKPQTKNNWQGQFHQYLITGILMADHQIKLLLF